MSGCESSSGPGVGPVYPVMMRLQQRPVLVVGGSAVAASKALGLLAAGARVTLVDPDPGPEVFALADRLTIHVRPYQQGEAAEYFLVVTTADAATNRLVFADGVASRTWVNSADDPDNCGFVLPAVLRFEPVVVAVSTAGTSPAMAQWVRNRIGSVIGPRHGQLSLLLADARRRINGAGLSNENLPWASLIDHLDDLLAAEDPLAAQAAIDEWVAKATNGQPADGTGFS